MRNLIYSSSSSFSSDCSTKSMARKFIVTIFAVGSPGSHRVKSFRGGIRFEPNGVAFFLRCIRSRSEFIQPQSSNRQFRGTSRASLEAFTVITAEMLRAGCIEFPSRPRNELNFCCRGELALISARRVCKTRVFSLVFGFTHNGCVQKNQEKIIN